MAFDKPTRNRLAKFVSDARGVIADEFTEQFQSLYGISINGEIAPLNILGHLDEAGMAAASLLRERIEYLEKTHPDDKDGTKAAVTRLAREQAFTILNRLAAIRMAEMRGLIVESVGKGYQSKGFKVFETVAGSALGDTYHRYRRYLFCLFDELAIDLGVLFDRRSPQALLFPREPALLALLDLLHATDLEALWAEDETIGWIYQYYNDSEERKKMRKESAAPRNSRELAVRNQFFTPRYVVEFLTDNTLGRIWYEMCRGKTRLAEQCRYLVRRPTEIFLTDGENAPEVSSDQSSVISEESLTQEQLLKQPVYIPHRTLKDPREIRLLDPACGSMHFGLYAFDLFETIYEEFWDMPANSSSAHRSLPTDHFHIPLHKLYASKEEFMREVPRMIIEHNIHGIDIDPRATQIAALSLWLRAQKAWQQQKVPAADRPRVRRSNIVCAEPMPGSPEMLAEFVASLTPPMLAELVKTVFDKMQLAGEAGSLLKIEEEMRTAIDTARKEWLKQRDDLLTRKDDSQEEFFDTAEQQVIDALRAYAEQADADSYQRRLFADDAARGFAFIDLCRKRYDAVVMNPPFGDPATGAASYLDSNYPNTKSELYASFIDRSLAFIEPSSAMGVIASRLCLFNPSLSSWRENSIYGSSRLGLLADLGHGVLDGALVEAAAFVIWNSIQVSELVTASALDTGDKDKRIFNTFRHVGGKYFFVSPLNSLQLIPGQPVAYWVSAHLVSALFKHPSLKKTGGTACVGLKTDDDFRFLRLSWEILLKDKMVVWRPFAKGGEYAPFYDDIHLTVNWAEEAKEMRAFIERNYSWTKRASSLWRYGDPGLTFPERTTSEFSPRILPMGTIFSNAGNAVFGSSRTHNQALLSLFYTRLYRVILELFLGGGDTVASGSAARHYKAGAISSSPIPDMTGTVGDELAKNGIEAARLALDLWSDDETSQLFVGLILSKDSTFLASCELNLRRREDNWAKLELITAHNEKLTMRCYDITTQEYDDIKNLYGRHTSDYPNGRIDSDISSFFITSVDGLVDQAMAEISSTRQHSKLSYWTERRYEIVAHLVKKSVTSVIEKRRAENIMPPHEAFEVSISIWSYALGLSFGRWDIRFANGERQPPELPDPFDPLPVCPPGMLQNTEGLPAEPKDVPDNYPLRISWPGILVDDENHPEDIVARVREAIEVIWKDRAEAIEQEACDILDVKTLRDYFRRPAAFFADHLKRYSKSRRQAPIYWPLSTKSGSYTLWLYYHRLTDQTLHTCLADFLDPKIRKVQSELDSLTGSGVAGNRVGELREFLDEIKDLRDEIDRIIKLPWKPNLNDGVLITASPLWKLFRLPKWQKDLKACWDKLAKGEYDWAHLAYSIRPREVEKACEKDRSIAIAHGLEHLCKIEPPKLKKKRDKKTVEEPELIEED